MPFSMHCFSFLAKAQSQVYANWLMLSYKLMCLLSRNPSLPKWARSRMPFALNAKIIYLAIPTAIMDVSHAASLLLGLRNHISFPLATTMRWKSVINKHFVHHFSLYNLLLPNLAISSLTPLQRLVFILFHFFCPSYVN